MKRDKAVTWQRVSPAALQLAGQRIAVVGGTGGLGRALARALAAGGAHVIVVGRTFRDAGVRNIEFLEADLTTMREADRVAGLIPAETLDSIVFTTGIMAAPQRQETADGIERDMAISFLSRLVILRAVAHRLGVGRPAGRARARVFVMGFPGAGNVGSLDINAERSYKAMTHHMNTVAGNEILVLDAARRYPHLDVFGLNPGAVSTAIRSNFMGEGSIKHRMLEGVLRLMTPTPETYAGRIAPLLASPGISGHSGSMFDRKGDAVLPSDGLTEKYIADYLEASTRLVAKTGVPVAS
ncbi:SDR family NAD(P)-dependent oxidoreductase [Catenuloplanes sp. NPDC051500]|uniref:SDR family NAD(P)-dependent oxidoreductase n=1 Tax=Catenuloplanes sp. NPDC051500 TaxID=3363959 RepID=UPI003795703C